MTLDLQLMPAINKGCKSVTYRRKIVQKTLMHKQMRAFRSLFSQKMKLRDITHCMYVRTLQVNVQTQALPP